MYFRIDNYQNMEAALKELEDFLVNMDLSDESVFNSKLVASELIANVFQHSTGTAQLFGDVADGTIKIKVCSSMPYTPPDKSDCADVYEESGRGLYIIDSISEKRFLSPDGGICVMVSAKYRHKN